MIIEKLYQEGEIKKGTCPHKVRQVLEVLCNRLGKELDRKYLWMATATRAVDAGRWNGKKFKNRRIKLHRLVCICCDYLKIDYPDMPDNWERKGLHYDYGAGDTYAEEQGIPVEQRGDFVASMSLLSLLSKKTSV